MKNYKVTITETRHYYIEVEAESIVEADDKAFLSDKFTMDLCDDTDAIVTDIVEI